MHGCGLAGTDKRLIYTLGAQKEKTVRNHDKNSRGGHANLKNGIDDRFVTGIDKLSNSQESSNSNMILRC